MDLTRKRKKAIDALSYRELLRQWRFAPPGDPMMSGETGDYYKQRLAELRNQPGGQEMHVAASKDIGWQL